MATTTTRAGATEADLLATPKDGRKYELVDGEIRVSPAGMRHEAIGARLLTALMAFVAPRKLGHVLGSSMGYRLPSGNLRSPDVSVILAARTSPDREDFMDGPPDLAVEILSPGDRTRDVFDKVGEWLDAGARIVWVVDPRRRTASAYREAADVVTIDEHGEFDGADVLPGLRCRLGDVL